MRNNWIMVSLLLLTSCTNNVSTSSLSSSISNNFNPFTYIHESSYTELQEKILNKEDFIFTLSFSNCRWCQQQENDIFNFMYAAPIDIYVYELDTMFLYLEFDSVDTPLYGIEKYNAAKEEYRYFASCLEKIGDNYLQEEGAYIKNNYTDRFGEIEPALVYPSTLIYIDGELVIEFSRIGYGWTETVDSFQSFVNMYNNLIKFK